MDKKKIQEGVKLILEGIGENPDREGLLDTPDRIARMYEEIFGGLTQTAEEPLSKTFHVKDNAMVLEKDITFYSTCEHHLLPFHGVAHVGYIPSNGQVAGLSKLARLVELYAFLRKSAYCVYPGWKSRRSQQTGKNRGSVCKASADPGTVDGTDRRCINGIFKATGRNGHAGSRAYVHDDAGGEKAGKQDGNICDARCF